MSERKAISNKSFRRACRNGAMRAHKTNERMKEERYEQIREEYEESHKYDEIKLVFGGVGVILLVSFPVAYIFNLLPLFANLFFGLFDVFAGTSEPFEDLADPWESNFFYSTFWQRYFYCAALMSFIWALIGVTEKSPSDLTKGFMCVALIVFVAAVIMNFNLFVASIFGPIPIILGLLFTGKR